MNAPLKLPKLKKCRMCPEMFIPFSTTQRVCSPKCAQAHAEALRAKKERKEHREAKERIKPRSQWLKEVQSVFNQWIRLRDAKENCISCGRNHTGQWHAGHYKTVGANPELRFDERNVHKQCAPCNNHLSGNILNYRLGLLQRCGIETVEYLEGHHEPKRYTIDDLKELKAYYQKKCKELERALSEQG